MCIGRDVNCVHVCRKGYEYVHVCRCVYMCLRKLEGCDATLWVSYI